MQSASGWALLLPFAHTLGPTAWFFDACWISGFVLVWSYWLGFLRTSPFRRALVGVAILVVGIGAVPIVFSVPASTVTDWIAGFSDEVWKVVKEESAKYAKEETQK